MSSGSALVLTYDRAPRWHRFIKPVVLLAWIYPLLPIIALYSLWLLTGIMLGRPVVFGDSAPIGELAHVGRRLVALVLLGAPMLAGVALPMALLLMPAWVRLRGTTTSANHLRVLLLLHYAVCAAFFFWDPLRALNWFMD